MFYCIVIYRSIRSTYRCSFTHHTSIFTHLPFFYHIKMIIKFNLIYLHHQNKSIPMSASKNCITHKMKRVPTSRLNSSTNPYANLNKMIQIFTHGTIYPQTRNQPPKSSQRLRITCYTKIVVFFVNYPLPDLQSRS